MASLREIRGRVRSIKNMQKITGAMKLVAASKLRRSQEAIFAVRPYANELGAMLHRIAARAHHEGDAAPHPVLDVRPIKKLMVVVLTSDRGLCGSFNTNILKRTERFVEEQRGSYERLEIATIGRKGRDYFRKRKVATVKDFPGVFTRLEYRRASEIADAMVKEYVARDLDGIFLIYNEFKSALTQRVVVQQLLPIVHEDLPGHEEIDYLYEPNQAAVLEQLVPRYVATIVWRSLLESAASEHGARMTAMDAASKNAKELVDRLSLQYNRTRQAVITRELMEIVGGAEALKG